MKCSCRSCRRLVQAPTARGVSRGEHAAPDLQAPRIMNINPASCIQTSELKSIRKPLVNPPSSEALGPNFGVFPVSIGSSFTGHSRHNRNS